MKLKSILSTVFALMLLGLALQSGASPAATGEILEPQVGFTAASSMVSAASSALEWPLQPFFASANFGFLLCYVPCTSHSQCQSYCVAEGYIIGDCLPDFGLECHNNRDDRYCACT